MTYASGGLIQATDYNQRATAVNNLWGTGANANGYGQSTTVTAVATSNTVTATQWATLIARMQSMQQHQFNNTTGVPSQPTAGSIITYLSTVDTKITDLNTNKMTGYTTTAGASTTASSATNWTTSAIRTFTVAFSSGDTARYFWNSGGNIQITTTGTSLTGNPKSTDWNSFITSKFNTYYFDSNGSSFTGTGATTVTNLSTRGYYQLTTAATTHLKLTSASATADYNLNEMYVNVNTSSQNISGSGDNGSTMTITVSMYDKAADSAVGTRDTVTGTVAINLALNYPETTYLSNTWGTGTITVTTNTQA